MQGQVLGNSALRIPCPEISRPGQSRLRHSGERSWRLGAQEWPVERKERSSMRPIQLRVGGSQSRKSKPVRVAAGRLGAVEIDAQIRVTAGAKEVGSACVDAENGLTNRGPCCSRPGEGYGRCGSRIDSMRIHKAVDKNHPAERDRILRLASDLC